MSINFATLQSLTIPEGVVKQIIDANGRVIWGIVSSEPEISEPVILEVEKVTFNTYAGETQYEDEQFILLDVYPKTNGTVTVTYSGLTKTITDTSGVAKPNAQQVFFGTFNGVSDSIETSASGELTIEGDYAAFGCGSFSISSKSSSAGVCLCITEVVSYGNIKYIPDLAFCNTMSMVIQGCPITNGKIPDGVNSIGRSAFGYCKGLIDIIIPYSVTIINPNAFGLCNSLTSATFNNTSGWWITKDASATSGTAVTVTDAANNATLLVSTYDDHYWRRT